MRRPFDEGDTIGQPGSEGGIILRDQENDLGAKITLERDCSHGIPFAVTCGIYGWFFHTRFLASESGDEWPTMLDELAAILDTIPRVDDVEAKARMDVEELGSAIVDAWLSVLSKYSPSKVRHWEWVIATVDQISEHEDHIRIAGRAERFEPSRFAEPGAAADDVGR